MKKSKHRCRSRYLILQHDIFTRMCLMTLLIKIILLFNQMIVEVDMHLKLIE